MENFIEIPVETYIKEVKVSSFGGYFTAAGFCFVIGIAIWPLFILGIVFLVMAASPPTNTKHRYIECPSCKKETIVLPNTTQAIFQIQKTQSGKDFTVFNDFKFQCSQCHTSMHYLNNFAIFKKPNIPTEYSN